MICKEKQQRQIRWLRVLFFVFSFCGTFLSYGVSLVYNLRIAEITRNQAHILKEGSPSIVTPTLFTQFRKDDQNTTEFVGGLLGTYIYTQDFFYFKVAAAGGNVHAKACDGTVLSQTQADDVLFSAGYGHDFGEQLRMSASLHLGIPTHSDTNLAELLELGTGHVGFGAQVDGSWHYAEHRSLLGALRVLHFFPRMTNATVAISTVAGRFKYGIGNLIDIFVSHQFFWKSHTVEVGYNPTFSVGATVQPYVEVIAKGTDFTANNFFISYTYGFTICSLQSAIVVGISAGFSHEDYGLSDKYIVTPWFSWGINF